MILGYPKSDMVFRLKGQRSTLGLTAIRRGFELCECFLVIIIIIIINIMFSLMSIFQKKLAV